MDSARYVLACHRYVERNPVRARMVESAFAYRWSSHGGNAGERSNALLTPHAEYLALGQDGAARLAAYRGLFGAEEDPEFVAAIRDATNGGFALVGKSFKAGLPAKAQRRLTRQHPGPSAPPLPEQVDIQAELGLRPRIS